VKRRDLERLLAENGCVKVRDKGKHTIWENSHGDTAAVPRHTEINKYTARGICRDLGIDPQNVTS
jgi:predicted RNA binding protein YcfA (HicA-like mRNA interferase family)